MMHFIKSVAANWICGFTFLSLLLGSVSVCSAAPKKVDVKPGVFVGINVVSSSHPIPAGANTPVNTKICMDIKKAGSYVELMAVVKADANNENVATDENLAPNTVTWTGGEAVPGSQLRRRISRDNWGKYTITATAYGTSFSVLVYIIGASYTSFSPANGQSGSYSNDVVLTPGGDPLPASTGIDSPNNGGPQEVESRCEVQFTVQPPQLITDGNNNIFDRTYLQWDVSRRKRLAVWWQDTASAWHVVVSETQGPNGGPPWSVDVWSSDDTHPLDEDNNPWDGQGHLYGTDKPAFNTLPQDNAELYKVNMNEFVRVAFDHSRPLDTQDTKWVMCSEYAEWHVFRSFKKGADLIFRNSTDYDGNAIATGNMFWGDVPSVLEISTTVFELPIATVGQPYSFTVDHMGGVGVVTWALNAGNLPTGLQLNTNGTISGTPSPGAVGEWIQLTATDSQTPAAQSRSRNYYLTVLLKISTTESALPTATVGQQYQVSLNHVGGLGTVTWTLTGGTLPTGLQLNTNGTISGTPLPGAVGTTSLQFTATDSRTPNAQTDSRSYTLTVANP